jgi:hypothetical protein
MRNFLASILNFVLFQCKLCINNKILVKKFFDWTIMGELRLFRVDLKVPKREIFVTELIILSHPIWVGDLRTKAKNWFLSIVRLLSAILFFYR